MSETVAKGKEALAAEEGKLKKLLKVVKKIVAKEFLWVLFILLVSIPLALAMKYIVEEYASAEVITAIYEVLDGNKLSVGCYAVSIAGFYFARMVVGAIKTLTEKK